VFFLALACRVSYDFIQNPAILVPPLKHRPRPPEQDDLLLPRLVDMIDLRHELVKLAGLIDWEVFEREWAGFFPSGKGRPATEPRLVAGLLYLQHAYRLSDEAVVARWVENPYYQHLTGEVFFQHKLPIDPSSLTRWRGRIGEEGVEWLLTQTIRAGEVPEASRALVARIVESGSPSRAGVPANPDFRSARAANPASSTRPRVAAKFRRRSRPLQP
jgi:IS5 family transposase